MCNSVRHVHATCLKALFIFKYLYYFIEKHEYMLYVSWPAEVTTLICVTNVIKISWKELVLLILSAENGKCANRWRYLALLRKMQRIKN